MTILLVDDDPSVRAILERALMVEGHTVLVVSDGLEAWEIILQQPIDILITDWLMPEISGLDLCRLVRAMDPGMYIYTILISAQGEDTDIVTAFEAGADDFLAKPIPLPVLHARIRAGERIIRLEHELARRGQTLLETNLKLKEARAHIQHDLEAGAELQNTLLPPRFARFGAYRSAWIYRPYATVAGDMLNVYQRDAETLVFYLFDVVGHGIRSALLTVSITKMLTTDTTLDIAIDPEALRRPAHRVLQSLNERFQSIDTSQYFTMIYGTIDLPSGQVHLGQAGHPPPILVSGDGDAHLIGEGGFPIGWLPDMEYDTFDFTLPPGGRLVLYSDGVTECENEEGEMFEKDRLMAHFTGQRALKLEECIDRLEHSLNEWTPNGRFTDDTSLLIIERDPEPGYSRPAAS